jgi:hypothetical protein
VVVKKEKSLLDADSELSRVLGRINDPSKQLCILLPDTELSEISIPLIPFCFMISLI